jgi:ferrous iron transport protein A
MEKTLNEIAVGQTGTVVGFAKGISTSRQKLLAMGLIKGTAFKVVRVAPMGDPVEIMVRDFSLSLRRAEATVLLVKEVGK